VEGDGFVITLGCDVDDDATRGDVLDGKTERRAPDRVEDQIEVAGKGLDDLGGAETAKELLCCGRVAHQRDDMGTALAGELSQPPTTRAKP
jgi:hypothetical protein